MSCILVTGAHGDIADAAARILREAMPRARLIGADQGGEWPGRAAFDAISSLPPATDSAYAGALRDLAGRESVSLILPTSEAELAALAQSDEIAGLPLLMNVPDLLRPLLDKLETARWLESAGVAAPRTTTLEAAQDTDLPLVVKPRRGRGSRDVHTVAHPKHLAALRERLGAGFVAQELVGDADAEFTCPLFRWRGDVRFVALKRRLSGGMTAQIEAMRHPAIDRLLERIGVALPDFAFVNAQVRVGRDGPKVFEINPRFSGTLMMRHRIGFSDLLWALAARAGEPLPPARTAYGARVWRRSAELVVAAA